MFSSTVDQNISITIMNERGGGGVEEAKSSKKS